MLFKNHLRLSFTFFGVLLISLIYNYLSPYSIQFLVPLSSILFHVSTLILLLKSGTLVYRKHWRIILAFWGLMLIGARFKILHLPGTDLILIVSLIVILLTYILAYLTKPIRKSLDHLKVLWILSYISTGILSYFYSIDHAWELLPSLLLFACLWQLRNTYQVDPNMDLRYKESRLL